ncbi:MAG: caspase family protein, partial [Thiomargarita sp.]|nr:caspase family protein [Thiomargarita sp.]
MLKNLIILIIITVVAIFIWQFEFKNNAGGGFEVKGYDSIGSSAENIPRVALVMGIASYKNAVFGSYEFGKLGNPVNDAVDMAKVLVNLGFTVILKQNLAGKREMTQAILEFRNKLPKNGRAVALFYFSGHGFQYKNVNYLVPSQMKIDSEIDVEYEVLSADYVLKHLKVANAQGTNLIFLDACRNDIPADAFGRWNSMGVDDVKAGFAVMKAPIGSLIAYSTAPKMAAWSATGARNSVYTKHLLKALETQPNANVINLLMSVRKGVLAETKDIKDKQGNSLQQATWEHFSLTDSFCFGGCVSDDLFQQRLAKIAAMEQAVRDREEALELEKERFEQQAITREAEFKRELAEKARKAAELKREQQQAEKQFQFVKLNYRGRRLTNSA